MLSLCVKWQGVSHRMMKTGMQIVDKALQKDVEKKLCQAEKSKIYCELQPIFKMTSIYQLCY